MFSVKPEELIYLLDAFKIGEDEMALFIRNYLINIDHNLEAHPFVAFKLFFHRIMFEHHVLPLNTGGNVEETLLHDDGKPLAISQIMYEAYDYNNKVLDVLFRKRFPSGYGVLIVANSNPDHSLNLIVEEVDFILGQTHADMMNFNRIVAHFSVKILQFLSNEKMTSAASSRASIIPEMPIDETFGQEESPHLDYHMNLV